MPGDAVPDKGSDMMHDTYWYGDGWGWGSAGWILMGVALVVFWAVVITLVVLAVRYLAADRGRPAPPASAQSRAEDLLAERFAHSEIDDEEYRRRLTLLREHRQSP
jgi:putative membrane protein